MVKSALFLASGAVTVATGKEKLSQVRGLLRRMPWLGIGSGVAAAGLAGLPLTVGFFKDDVLFKELIAHGAIYGMMAVAAVSLTLAYAWRWWSGIFLGKPVGRELHPVRKWLVAPILILAVGALLGGMVVGPLERLAGHTAEAVTGRAARLELAYHFDFRAANIMALTAYGIGLCLIGTRGWWEERLSSFVGALHWAAIDAVYERVMESLNKISTRAHRLEIRDGRGRFAVILGTAAVLLSFGVVVGWRTGEFSLGVFGWDELPAAVAFVVAITATFAVVVVREHLALILAMSCLNYSLVAVFLFLGCPDVALVAVVIESIFTLLFLGVLSLFPESAIAEADRLPKSGGQQWRDRSVACMVGVASFFAVWRLFSEPAVSESVAVGQIELAEKAHAKDVVTAVLADFRGLDTAGEITVLGIALLGIVSLLRWRGAR